MCIHANPMARDNLKSITMDAYDQTMLECKELKEAYQQWFLDVRGWKRESG